MSENLITESKETIKNLKLEILEKQEKLISLLEQYQNKTSIETEDINKQYLNKTGNCPFLYFIIIVIIRKSFLFIFINVKTKRTQYKSSS